MFIIDIHTKILSFNISILASVKSVFEKSELQQREDNLFHNYSIDRANVGKNYPYLAKRTTGIYRIKPDIY